MKTKTRPRRDDQHGFNPIQRREKKGGRIGNNKKAHNQLTLGLFRITPHQRIIPKRLIPIFTPRPSPLRHPPLLPAQPIPLHPVGDLFSPLFFPRFTSFDFLAVFRRPGGLLPGAAGGRRRPGEGLSRGGLFKIFSLAQKRIHRTGGFRALSPQGRLLG